MAHSEGSLIDGRQIAGGAGFHGMNPARNLQREPEFSEASADDVARACEAAAAAFDRYREISFEQRAAFLEKIATRIEAIGAKLIETGSQETGLPPARIETERARTLFQLRLFARVVRDGGWVDARIDPALPDRKPLPRTDLRLRMIGVGPVAVFGSSNFPLAFSVAGGDTASALAAGCPVVVKAHPAHPATSLLVGKAVQEAVTACGLPAGVFSLLFGAGTELGGALVADPRIKSVGFTGSRGGGLALVKIAAGRAEPIPVHAEMSSINPVLLLPHALRARCQEIAKGFVASLTLGAGQFCTNPGLLIAQAGPDLDKFIEAVREELAPVPAATMLTAGIFKAYEKGVAALTAKPTVTTAARGKQAAGENEEQPAFFVTEATDFLADASLSSEVFGASALLVSCPDLGALNEVLGALEGQLTISLQMDDADTEAARVLLPALERKAGRLLVNEWPTGVEVCDAMVHGGPFPATSDPRTTSVGTLAIRRFLRPVCYQNFPAALLPEALREGNPLGIPRLLDGKLQLSSC